LLAFAQIGPLPAGAVHAADRAAKPEFRITAGKDTTICEAYLKHLKAMPAEGAPRFCEIWFDPKRSDFVRPQWEEINVLQNLDLVRRIERCCPNPYNDIPHMPQISEDMAARLRLPRPGEEGWAARYEALMREGFYTPRLRRTQLRLDAKEAPETVLAYHSSAGQCRPDGKYREGEDLAVDTAVVGARHYLLREGGEVRPGFHGHVGTALPGEILLFQGRPFVFRLHTSPASSRPYSWVLMISAIGSNHSWTDGKPEYVAIRLPFRCTFRYFK